ncbi:MAG: RagB/SusD family nutrient uptake outer membrane protein, partial [Prevotella sp.]|nr:RagB/SusD family nutrient uptake outer membrane protein [Prevotella sp.]
MKKIIISLLAAMGALTLPSCSDMLETESSRQLFDKELDSKTDSVHFAFGVMQAMQQLADQYVFIGEMRGDLVRTTEY